MKSVGEQVQRRILEDLCGCGNAIMGATARVLVAHGTSTCIEKMSDDDIRDIDRHCGSALLLLALFPALFSGGVQGKRRCLLRTTMLA